MYVREQQGSGPNRRGKWIALGYVCTSNAAVKFDEGYRATYARGRSQINPNPDKDHVAEVDGGIRVL